MEADPINTATGNKFQQETDFALNHWLTFRRFYNSSDTVSPATLGAQWRHSFNRSLAIPSGNIEGSIAILERPDGKRETFTKKGSQWISDPDIPDTLVEIDGVDGQPVNYVIFVAGLKQFETYSTSGLLQSVRDESGLTSSFIYSSADTPSNIAPRAGLLLKVTDPYGRAINFKYDYSSRIAQIILPGGESVKYSYDADSNLVSARYPDGKERQYIYGEFALTSWVYLPHALTGVIDEQGARFESTGYDVDGRAVTSRFAEGASTTSIIYKTDGSASLKMPLGDSTNITFQNILGRYQVSSSSNPCGTQCRQPWKNRTFDANGYPATFTDFKGNVIAATYDSQGLMTRRVDAQGQASQRTIDISWDTALRVPLSRAIRDANGKLVSNTKWTYNTTGQTLARCDIDPTNSAASVYNCSNTGTVPAGVRRWTYTYCATIGTGCPLTGLLLTATGPRTDLTQTTTYTYYTTSSATNCGTPGAACYQPGDLYQITDALGHVITLASYDADGRITRITDANGVNTDLTYTPRGWLASRSVGGATTNFTYTPYGAVQTVTDPDGVTTTYGYDAAHRLVKITDALGNYIQYTLDAAGDKTAEQVYDATGTLHKSLTRTFNTLGQLTSVVDGLNQTVFNASASGSYDANGNLVQSSDGLNIQRQLGYDALNRLVQTIDNYNGSDAATKNTTTGYSYDSLDRLTQVTDPSSLNTTYSYDGLSDATGQMSPDTGSTSRTFDAAGNVLTRTDAKGIIATNTYDALDRLISTSYPDSSQNATYSYDDANGTTGCSSGYPVGRLTRIIEASVTTVYCYDAQGRVTSKSQSLSSTSGTLPVKLPNFGSCPSGMMCANDISTNATTDVTGYRYTAAGRLSGITYPSGTSVVYARDGDGRIQSISVTPPNGAANTAVSSVTYQPFGPVTGYTLGNGQQIVRSYDANYRLIDLTSPAFGLHVARDAMGDIVAMGNAPGTNPATETYGYDPLYRLTAVTEADGSTLESVTYNQTGDRLSKTGSGLATGAYSYNTGTHQLIATGNAARSVDANGNTIAISQAGSTYGFGYSDRNRMVAAQLAGSTVGTYTYNALDERVQKVANGLAERFDYNEGSQILAEYGASNRDYIWMDGIPVANVDTVGTTTTLAYVTADLLGAPRAIADSSGNTEWRNAYQGNPWNELAPTTTGYTYNLGFPGQYFDAETGLYLNGPRYFDAAKGGFDQADPIGQLGGNNVYDYTGDNPLHFVDASGLQRTDELDPKTSEALNTPETNAEVARLDEEAKEDAEANDTTPYIPPRDPSEFGELGTCKATPSNPVKVGPQGGTNFVVTPSGTAYPIPNGATGPEPTRNERGMQFQGGSGGNGLDPKTTGFRLMDPVTSGPYQYPNGYGSYNNASGQTVNPYTGSPNISKTDPMWHIVP
jgi:RHS repeat-associated protein